MPKTKKMNESAFAKIVKEFNGMEVNVHYKIP